MPPSTPAATTDNQPIGILASKRHSLVIAALYISTFGLYSSFWLVGRVREFNKLQNKITYRPWLWFFVPLFLLPQFIALPKFFNELQKLSKEYHIELPSNQGVLWMVTLFTVTLTSNIEMKYELPIWATLLYVIAGATAFAGSQHWFNLLKQQCTSYAFKRPRFIFTAYEWPAIILGISIWGVATIEFGPELFPSGKKLEDNNPYTLTEHEFSLPISGDHWHADAPGGEDSIAVISGKLMYMHFDIYHYGFSESLNSVSYWRLKEMQKYLDAGSKCTHERFFDADSTNVIAFGVCTGTDTLDPAIHTVTVIDTPNKGTYELYGQFSAPKLSFEQYKQSVLDMARGFKAK